MRPSREHALDARHSSFWDMIDEATPRERPAGWAALHDRAGEQVMRILSLGTTRVSAPGAKLNGQNSRSQLGLSAVPRFTSRLTQMCFVMISCSTFLVT
jgi:hypothetical protein